MSFFRQCALACMGWFGLAVHAVDRQEMVDGLIAVHNIIQAGYAPLDWKREFLNWNEEATFGRAEGLVFANQPLYLKGYHQIVRDCLGSLHDHHVSVLFFSTE